MTFTVSSTWFNSTTNAFDNGPTDAASAVNYLRMEHDQLGGGASRNMYRLLTGDLGMDWRRALLYVLSLEVGDVSDDLRAEVDALALAHKNGGAA